MSVLLSEVLFALWIREVTGLKLKSVKQFTG